MRKRSKDPRDRSHLRAVEAPDRHMAAIAVECVAAAPVSIIPLDPRVAGVADALAKVAGVPVEALVAQLVLDRAEVVLKRQAEAPPEQCAWVGKNLQRCPRRGVEMIEGKVYCQRDALRLRTRPRRG